MSGGAWPEAKGMCVINSSGIYIDMILRDVIELSVDRGDFGHNIRSPMLLWPEAQELLG